MINVISQRRGVAKNDIQHISESSRQDEFQGEPAERILIREHRRILQNSLVSSFMECAVNI
ncbi:MAG: palindromic element RPE3 domain-containing protein, partial [Rickettsia sp.]